MASRVRRVGVLVFIAAMGLGTSEASAAPFPLPSQTTNLVPPAVAVDPSGNAYVAWYDASAPTPTDHDRVSVCQIPAGSLACAPGSLQDLPGSTTYSYGTHTYLFIDSGGRPDVLISGYNGSGAQTIQFASTDGGQHWSPSSANPIGDIDFSSATFDSALGNVTFGASTAVTGAAVTGGAAQLDTPAAPGHDATLVPGGGAPTETASGVADTASGIDVVHAWNSGTSSASNGVGVARLHLPPGTTAAGALTAAGTPSSYTVSTLNDGGDDLSVAGGPAGVYLGESLIGRGYVLRGLTSSGFGQPTLADCGDTGRYGAGLQDENLAEDSMSALHALYLEGTGSAIDVRYTKIAGGTQSPPQTLGSYSGNVIFPRVAPAGGGHAGLAIWEIPSPSGSGKQVIADWLPAVTLSGCPTPTHPGGPPPPASTQSSSTTSPDGQTTLTVTTPNLTGCLPATVLTVAESATPTKHKHTKSSLKLSSVQFVIDKGVKHTKTVKRHHHKVKVSFYTPNATAHHLPASVKLSLKGLKAGKHKLTVTTIYKQTVTRHHHKVTVTRSSKIKLSFTIC